MTLSTQQYTFTRGSDLERDGMFVEANVLSGNASRTIAEVFYSDQTGEFSLTCFEQNVPLELIENLILEGRKWLPPSNVPR